MAQWLMKWRNESTTQKKRGDRGPGRGRVTNGAGMRAASVGKRGRQPVMAGNLPMGVAAMGICVCMSVAALKIRYDLESLCSQPEIFWKEEECLGSPSEGVITAAVPICNSENGWRSLYRRRAEAEESFIRRKLTTEEILAVTG